MYHTAMFPEQLRAALTLAVLVSFGCAEPMDLAAGGLSSTRYDMELKPLMLSTGDNPYCNVDTGGGCRVEACYKWRGPTECVGDVLDKKCLCQKGYCAHDGVCIATTTTTTTTTAPTTTTTTTTMVVAMSFMMFVALGVGLLVRSFRHRMDAPVPPQQENTEYQPLEGA